MENLHLYLLCPIKLSNYCSRWMGHQVHNFWATNLTIQWIEEQRLPVKWYGENQPSDSSVRILSGATWINKSETRYDLGGGLLIGQRHCGPTSNPV